MTAKEFLESNGIKYDHEATGMSTYVQNAGSTINAMEQILEEYHQAKLKLLGIADVVEQSEQLVCDVCFGTGVSKSELNSITTCNKCLGSGKAN